MLHWLFFFLILFQDTSPLVLVLLQVLKCLANHFWRCHTWVRLIWGSSVLGPWCILLAVHLRAGDESSALGSWVHGQNFLESRPVFARRATHCWWSCIARCILIPEMLHCGEVPQNLCLQPISVFLVTWLVCREVRIDTLLIGVT